MTLPDIQDENCTNSAKTHHNSRVQIRPCDTDSINMHYNFPVYSVFEMLKKKSPSFVKKKQKLFTQIVFTFA